MTDKSLWRQHLSRIGRLLLSWYLPRIGRLLLVVTGLWAFFIYSLQDKYVGVVLLSDFAPCLITLVPSAVCLLLPHALRKRQPAPDCKIASERSAP
ncbi:MAG: hypothetical protein IKK21_04650 [Clostridia bacterium]|nr:hypothetical protein [Clostridia bacterium]